MAQTFLLMLPFALAGAVSPMVLTEQTVLLTASIYAAGGQSSS